ncbi:MAG: cyclic pyranopterin monophosphate synthase MoaC [Opitutaceae bacterium]
MSKKTATSAPGFSHLDAKGRAKMVDVGAKPDSVRLAIAEGRLTCAKSTIRLLRASALPKGDVLTVAQVAGISAAKATSTLIPLCHPLALTSVAIEFSVEQDGIVICATVRTTGKTGVEMEALTAVSVAALTIYDMCKAVDKGMSIGGLRVVQKLGGGSAYVGSSFLPSSGSSDVGRKTRPAASARVKLADHQKLKS